MNLKMSLHHNGLVLSTQCWYEFLTTYNRDSHYVSIYPIYFPMMQTNGFCYALYRFASIIGSHSMVRFLSNSFRSLHQNYGHNATDPTAMQKYCGAYWYLHQFIRLNSTGVLMTKLLFSFNIHTLAMALMSVEYITATKSKVYLGSIDITGSPQWVFVPWLASNF